MRKKPKSAKDVQGHKVPSCRRHRFQVSSWQGPFVAFTCACGASFARKMDAKERRRFRRDFLPVHSNGIHRVFHDFEKRFHPNGKWVTVGYDLACRVERWAKKYPGDVRIVGVDDSAFASSMLVLIESRADKKYMGTNVVYIPQCTGESPIQFFLYPGHRESLAAALREIAREAAPRKKAESEAERANTRWWNSRASFKRPQASKKPAPAAPSEPATKETP